MEENKLELKGTCFGQEKLNLKQIPALGATWITSVLQLQSVVKLPGGKHHQPLHS